MRNTWTIAWKDYRAYFNSPIAYVIIGAFLGIMGWMFANNLHGFYVQTQSARGPGGGVSLTQGIIRPLYGNMNVIFLLMTPLLTMRLFAEEKKNRTIELLMTTPVTTAQMVLGKFLSVFMFMCTVLAATFIYPIILMICGNPDMGAIFTAYLGTLLLACCYLSLGVLFSSMTENQIIAAIMTFFGGLFFWLVPWASQAAGPFWGEIFNYLSLITHFSNFSKGVLDISDFVYYLSFIGMGLFLTYRVIDSYRWR